MSRSHLTLRSRTTRRPRAVLTRTFGACIAVSAAGCGESPVLGESRCDYPLAACAQEPLANVVDTQQASWLISFDVRATSRVAPLFVYDLPICDNLVFGCLDNTRLLPTRAPDEVWLAHGDVPDAGPDAPWLERLTSDGSVRETVPRGSALWGATGDVTISDGAGGVALFRDQATAIDDGEPHPRTVPQLFVHAESGDERLLDLEVLAHRQDGPSYVSPALFSDGSLRLRERSLAEAPTSLRVVAIDRDGELLWRTQYSPKQSALASDATALELATNGAPMDVGFALPGDHYGVLATVPTFSSEAIALVVIDRAGRYFEALDTFATPRTDPTVGAVAVSSGGELAYSISDISNQGASMSITRGAFSEPNDPNSLRGDIIVGRRAEYYAVDGGGLALDQDGAAYSLAYVGDAGQPELAVCKIPADQTPPHCTKLDLCAGTEKQLTAPNIALNLDFRGGDGVTLLVPQPDVVWTRIQYGCADKADAEQLANSSLSDLFSDPETIGALYARVMWHDQIVGVDLRSAPPDAAASEF